MVMVKIGLLYPFELFGVGWLFSLDGGFVPGIRLVQLSLDEVVFGRVCCHMFGSLFGSSGAFQRFSLEYVFLFYGFIFLGRHPSES